MTFSLGGGKRALLLVAATPLLLSLSACSSDDSPAAEPTKAAVTPDPKEAVRDLASRYWQAIVRSENNGDTDPQQFADVAEGAVVEDQISTLKTYKKLGLLRIGQPAITDIEVTIAGDTADIRLCKNEDGWTAEQHGEPVPNDKKFGNDPWGAEATKVRGTWLITDVRLPPKGSKTCS